jgi:hypothetical protein
VSVICHQRVLRNSYKEDLLLYQMDSKTRDFKVKISHLELAVFSLFCFRKGLYAKSLQIGCRSFHTVCFNGNVSLAASGNICPGRKKSSDFVFGSARSRAVIARSAAEIPVVVPSLASTLTRKAVP